jgi:protein-S-isoprenylcysteine O-methyltransferase Ste14
MPFTQTGNPLRSFPAGEGSRYEKWKRLYYMWMIVKIIGFTMLVPGIEAILVPFLLTNGHLFNLLISAHGWHISGWLLVGFGLLFYIMSTTGFAVTGRGTPAPFDPPKQLVAAGIHSFTRNPMYIGIVSFVIGLAVLSGLWSLFIYGIGLFAFFNTIVFIYEEPTLKKSYGLAYEKYCLNVPRWGIRIQPYSSEQVNPET